MRRETSGFVIGRDNNLARVDFRREPDSPAPKFPNEEQMHASSDGRGGESRIGRGGNAT
jgi:hypothetical protein